MLAAWLSEQVWQRQFFFFVCIIHCWVTFASICITFDKQMRNGENKDTETTNSSKMYLVTPVPLLLTLLWVFTMNHCIEKGFLYKFCTIPEWCENKSFLLKYWRENQASKWKHWPPTRDFRVSGNVGVLPPSAVQTSKVHWPCSFFGILKIWIYSFLSLWRSKHKNVNSSCKM